MRTPSLIAAAVLASAVVSSTASAAGPVNCRLDFNLAGWSVFYRTASGDGVVQCDNGQSMPVRVQSRGGGLSFGKSRIDNASGKFSGVYDIKETLGNYAAAEAHAGAVKSSDAQALTKGEVSLALSGKGSGWDLGVSVGKFVIAPKK